MLSITVVIFTQKLSSDTELLPRVKVKVMENGEVDSHCCQVIPAI